MIFYALKQCDVSYLLSPSLPLSSYLLPPSPSPALLSHPSPVPPSVSVDPPSAGVNEGGTVTFRCLAGGTQPTVLWSSLLGNQPLPSGVVQNGNDLVITQVSQTHAGQYRCTITNSAGSTSTSVVTLTVFCEFIGNYLEWYTMLHFSLTRCSNGYYCA